MLQQNTDLSLYVGVDFDEEAIKWNRNNLSADFTFVNQDIFDFQYDELFDSIISIDVIEHLEPTREKEFCEVITRNIKDDGVAIIGTPNITMTPYASEGSKMSHINLYDQKKLYGLFEQCFNNVFIFGMNDETVHVSFEPMSCFIFAVCTGKK